MASIISILDKIYLGSLNFFMKYTDKFIISFLILFIGFILARLLEKVIHKILDELEINEIFRKTVNVKKDVEKLISRSVAFIIYFITIIAVLNNLGLATTVLNIILSAILLIIIISFILAVKDFIPNFFAGILIHKNKLVLVKDIIKTKGIEGTVEEITLLQTKVRTKNKDIIHIPNSSIIKSEVIVKRK